MNVEQYYETKEKNEKDYMNWLIQEIQKIEVEMGLKLYTPPSERSKVKEMEIIKRKRGRPRKDVGKFLIEL